MGLLKVLAVLMTGISYCVIAHPQQSQIKYNGNSNSTTKSARMIANVGGSKNSVDNIPIDDIDSGFDNSPGLISRDHSEIFFPSDLPPRTEIFNGQSPTVTPNSSRMQVIPLNALEKFGAVTQLASFYSKYVKNTKVVTDSDTDDEYLVHANGTTLLNAKNEKFVLATGNRRLRRPEVGIKPRVGNKPTGVNHSVPHAASLPDQQDGLLTRLMPSATRQTASLSGCSPEKTTVSVPLKVEPNMLIIPKCVKVERCGGCCLSDLTVCEPEETEMTEFVVSKLRYVGDSNGDNPSLMFDESAVVKIEKHKRCKCKCRVKPEHCRSHHHSYVENQCSCVCNNYEDHQRCVDGSDNRIWDNETCQCSCKDIKTCSSNYRFDMNTCNCEKDVEFEARAGRVRAPRKTRNLHKPKS